MPPDISAAPKRISADRGAFLLTMKQLWPYMWPAERADLRMRVVWAFVLLLLSMVVTLIMAYTLKWATDGLGALNAGKVLTGSALAIWLAGLPLSMLGSYGATRFPRPSNSQW